MSTRLNDNSSVPSYQSIRSNGQDISPSDVTVAHSVSNKKPLTNTCCGYTYRLQCVPSKGAVLVLLWGLMLHMFIPYYTSIHLLNLTFGANNILPYYFGRNFYRFTFLIYPIVGWIADTKLGRYKTLYYSTIFIFISSVLMVVGYFIHILIDSCQWANVVVKVLLGFGLFFNIIGFACMDANIIPFVTDQVQEASGEKLSALIHWHFLLSAFAEFVNIIIEEMMILYGQYFTISILLIHVILSFGVLICCKCNMFTKWLDVVPRKTNPIKQIAKVLKNAFISSIHHRTNRSALTYWEDTIPSRLDLCKNKYGGLYTEEEVEDVKTTLRLLPFMFLSVCFGLTLNPTSYPKAYQNSAGVISDFLSMQSFHNSIYTIIFIILFHLFIYPCFYNYIPSMLNRIRFGIFLTTLSLIYLAVLDPITQITNTNQICILSNISLPHQEVYSLGYYWTLPGVIMGALGELFIVPFALEFIVAQTPGSMKGMMVGLWFTFYGLIHIISFSLFYPFSIISDSSKPSCIFYYFLLKALISITIFLIYVYFAYHYKMRIRNAPVNFHLLAENHFNKYLCSDDSDSDSDKSSTSSS